MSDIIDIQDQGWAKEETLKRLVDIMSSKFGSTKKQAGDYINAASSKTINEEVKARKQLLKDLERDTKEVGLHHKEINKNKQEFSKLSKAMGVFRTATALAKGAIAGIGAGLIATGKELFTMSLDIERAGLAHALRTTGDDAGDAIGNMAIAAQRMSLSMGALADVLNEYGKSVGTYGIKSFSVGVESMYQSTKQFGTTTKEAASFFGSYLETQRRAGMVDQMTRADTMRGAKEAFKQNVLMARAMKTSREDLRKQFEALTEDPDVNFLMNDLMGKLGTDVQAQFELISGALGPDMSAAIIDAAHAATFTGTSAAADSVQRLWSEGAIETGNIVSELGEKLANGTMTIEEINKLQTKLKAGTLDQERLISGTLKAIGEGDYARRIQSQLAMFATTYGKSAEETQEAADELAQLTAKVKVAFGDVSIAFQRFALELMNSEAFQKALNWLATDGAKEIAGFIDYIRTKIPQLRGALESMFDFIIDIAPTLKEHWPLVAAGFGTALLAALTAPALLTGIGLAASKAIATMATRGLSMAGGGLMNLLKNIKLPTLAGAGRMLGGGVAGAVAWEAGSAAGDALYEAIGDKEWFTNFVDSALDIATGKSNLQIEIAKRMSQSEDKQLSAPIKTPAPAQVPATSNKTSAGTIPTPVPEQINSTTDKNNSNVITNELLRKIHAALGDVNTTLKTIDKLH